MKAVRIVRLKSSKPELEVEQLSEDHSEIELWTKNSQIRFCRLPRYGESGADNLA